MLKELYTAAMGMLPQQTRLETIANNMANASTTGFKRSSVFERNLIDARANFYNVQGQAEQDDPPVGSYVDYAAGALQKTDNPLDLALENPTDFFLLRDDDGNQFLTRSGAFTLSPDGTVINSEGKKLVSDMGEINLNANLGDGSKTIDQLKADLKISENGEIFLGSTPLGAIKIIRVEDLNTIEQISNSNFIAREETEALTVPPEEVRLKQGHLENSNVDIISEMVAMIELQRLYEVGSKVIHTNDNTLDGSMKIGRYY